jgi:Putative abortive phage resistance protein AbiGi, antitoxin
MNSEISSEYLFHFTPKLEYLKGILTTNGFIPFYCLERLDYLQIYEKNGNKFEMAFPMVCFCDLTFDKQSIHKGKFGNYGIGLSKSWGKSKILSPVTYCSEKTLSSISLKLLINLAYELKENLNENQWNTLNNSLSILMMHFKSYEGFAYNKKTGDFDSEISRFYDEREWRYIPLEVNGLKYNLTRSEFENEKIRKKENERIQKDNKLLFSVNDINYIILKSESEIAPLLFDLRNSFSEKYVQLIKSKIRITH